MFLDEDTGERLALHIENKIARSVWTANQAENYVKRATARMQTYNYVDFQTVLMAPKEFLEAWPYQAGQFDIVLEHEHIVQFVPEFAAT